MHKTGVLSHLKVCCGFNLNSELLCYEFQSLIEVKAAVKLWIWKPKIIVKLALDVVTCPRLPVQY